MLASSSAYDPRSGALKVFSLPVGGFTKAEELYSLLESWANRTNTVLYMVDFPTMKNWGLTQTPTMAFLAADLPYGVKIGLYSPKEDLGILGPSVDDPVAAYQALKLASVLPTFTKEALSACLVLSGANVCDEEIPPKDWELSIDSVRNEIGETLITTILSQKIDKIDQLLLRAEEIGMKVSSEAILKSWERGLVDLSELVHSHCQKAFEENYVTGDLSDRYLQAAEMAEELHPARRLVAFDPDQECDPPAFSGEEPEDAEDSQECKVEPSILSEFEAVEIAEEYLDMAKPFVVNVLPHVRVAIEDLISDWKSLTIRSKLLECFDEEVVEVDCCLDRARKDLLGLLEMDQEDILDRFQLTRKHLLEIGIAILNSCNLANSISSSEVVTSIAQNSAAIGPFIRKITKLLKQFNLQAYSNFKDAYKYGESPFEPLL